MEGEKFCALNLKLSAVPEMPLKTPRQPGPDACYGVPEGLAAGTGGKGHGWWWLWCFPGSAFVVVSQGSVVLPDEAGEDGVVLENRREALTSMLVFPVFPDLCVLWPRTGGAGAGCPWGPRALREGAEHLGVVRVPQACSRAQTRGPSLFTGPWALDPTRRQEAGVRLQGGKEQTSSR